MGGKYPGRGVSVVGKNILSSTAKGKAITEISMHLPAKKTEPNITKSEKYNPLIPVSQGGCTCYQIL